MSATRARTAASRPASAAVRVLMLLSSALPALGAAIRRSSPGPLHLLESHHSHDPDAPDVEPGSATFWWKLGISGGLVLAGGVFAGLTLGLMGLDSLNLQVLSESGTPSERKQATKVLKLLERGRHWVLVVLLLSNVITNESLPIFLDSILGGGVWAVVISTGLIVIFGEIIPQSVCVRYGLPIGAASAHFVLALMWIMAPIAWPIAKLLDYILGHDEGTTYRKAELKTFVSLHRHMGEDQLNDDEVTIISAVLELGQKTIESISTPLQDVFSLSNNQKLDEKLVNEILEQGYSRMHEADNKSNYLGMLLVKVHSICDLPGKLLPYDPEDSLPVSSFQLSALPEAPCEMTCLEALNFFQQGQSHILLVSKTPGEKSGAVGIVTLEDVVEEMIGEEIVDEYDQFVDVHRKIRVVRRPQLGATRASITGKSLTPLLKGAASRRADSTQQSPKPQRSATPTQDTPAAQYGTLTEMDRSDPTHGPTAQALSKVKVKETGGTSKRRDEIHRAGAAVAAAPGLQRLKTTSTPVPGSPTSSRRGSNAPADAESQPLLGRDQS